MSSHQSGPVPDLKKPENYTISTLEDELRADRCCAALLREFHRYLLQELQAAPLEAGSLAAGADYFLREFIIGSRHENILEIPARRIRQFGGHWYIIRNLEPNLAELREMIRGTEAFYRYGAATGMISQELAEEIARECAQLPFFESRIEDFHNIVDDGYEEWNKACPLD